MSVNPKINKILDQNITNQLFKESNKDNIFSYILYFNRLCELAVSVFEWKDLPDTCDERFLETTLMCNGYSLFFKDEIMGFLNLPCTLEPQLSVYNVPLKRMAYASNGYQNRKDATDSVIIYNNELRTNDYLMIEYYARRLWFIDQIIDININAQKTPVLVEGDQKQRLTLKNLYQKYDGNQPFIFGDNGLGSQPLRAINTGAPFVADKLYQIRTDIWNEALTFIGISNIAIQKKERLISDEVQRNNAGTVNSRYSRLHARKQACKEINKMFGLNVSVAVREDLEGADVNPPEKPNNTNIENKEAERGAENE